MIALRYGTLPIVRETGGLADTVAPYNEYTSEGSGFTFTNYNAHDMLFVLRKAVSDYKNKEEWSKLMYRAATSDFSWSHSAKEYEALYLDMLK